MFLLVFMGMLGGAISVMRGLVDPSLKSPTIAEFFYRPAAGAAISIGVYVLFRAAQIFLGVQSHKAAPRPHRPAYSYWPAWDWHPASARRKRSAKLN